MKGQWQGDPDCCSAPESSKCGEGFKKEQGPECGRGSWGVAYTTLCLATAEALLVSGAPLLNPGSPYFPYVQANYFPDGSTTDPPDLLDKSVCLPVHGIDRTTCTCSIHEYHNRGLPGVNPQDWGCRPCPAGAFCGGHTFPSMKTRPGWYILGNASKTSHATRPSLEGVTDITGIPGRVVSSPKFYRCASDGSCPGYIGVLTAMVSNLTATNQCGEFTGNGTEWTRSGFEGILCGVCEEGRYAIGKTCAQCEFNQRNAWILLLGICIAVAAFLVSGSFVLKHLKRSTTERVLLKTLRRIEAEGGYNAVAEKFQTVFCREGKEVITKKDLNAGLDVLGIPHRADQRADLWRRLDQDGDGCIDMNEFMGFVVGMRQKSGGGGQGGSSSKVGIVSRRVKSVAAWWKSIRTKTIITVLIGYIQLWNLLDEIPVVEPPPVSNGLSDLNRESVPVTNGNNSTTATETLFTRALAAAGNLQVTALGFFECLLGQRHYSKLGFLTIVPLAFIALVWLPTLTLNLAPKIQPKLLLKHRATISLWRRSTSRIALMVSGNIIFLIYPNACNAVLRTFVCNTYTDADGRQTQWLADDLLLKCDTASDTNYAMVWALAVAMIFIVVVGMPLVLTRILWFWRYPINMLYVSDETGTWVPAAEADAAVGTLYGQYKAQFWAFGKSKER